jgi:hypothetical protein
MSDPQGPYIALLSRELPSLTADLPSCISPPDHQHLPTPLNVKESD